MFDAAICDWDGTLADTRKAIDVSFHKALQEIGLDVPTEYIERRIGIGAADTFREILQAQKGTVDEKVVEQLVDRKSQLQTELAGEVSLFEGARELLEALQGKVKLGLASMNNRGVIVNLLQEKHLEECFEVVLTVESVTKSKPNPEIFLKTAEALGVRSDRCVVLEDSIFGVEAAKAGGMACIAVTTGVYNAEELAAAITDLIVQTLRDPRVVKFVLR